jgi:hypothetical protein
MEDGDSRPQQGIGGGGSRRKRRRARGQRSKRHRPQQESRVGGGPRADSTNRERMFQDVEGLLRQIREHAEETTEWSEEELREITHNVTTFTRNLEQESEPISERARGDYQRLRDKLTQALRNKAA